jgi:SAM-dependent methyltransferase
MFPSSSINPFYRANHRVHSSPATRRAPRTNYAKLPRAPITASPVPHLTSLYHSDRAGDYGSRSYPGNCGGNLIKDLLQFYRPNSVFDPMTGSGTCRDVCYELGIPCVSTDLKSGFDATDPDSYSQFADSSFEFVWAHPPYWRQKVYSDNPHDLSTSATLEDFLRSYERFIRECARLLSPHGKFAILMGDYSDRDTGFVSLTYYTKQFAFAYDLKQASTDIIRFSHGASSSRKTYRSSFIPGLHDVCMVFERHRGR